MARRSRTTAIAAALLVGAGVGVGAALAEIAARLLDPEWRDYSSGRFIERIDVAGFPPLTIGRPGFDGAFAQNDGDFRVRIAINDFGLRNSEPVGAADGRIWVVGDSYAFGWGVSRDEALASIIASRANAPTYSIASPGTDICGYEALIARMPRETRPRAVIVGLVMENDIHDYRCREPASGRTQTAPAAPAAFGFRLSEIKRRLTAGSAFYNVAAIALKRIVVANDLLVAVGLVEREHVFHQPFPAAEIDRRVERSAAEIDWLKGRFVEGTPFAVLIVPARFEIRDRHPFYAGLRGAVTEALARRQIDVIDPFRRFEAAGFAATHFPHDGHWSALGHRIAGEVAAEWVAERLAAGRRPDANR